MMYHVLCGVDDGWQYRTYGSDVVPGCCSHCSFSWSIPNGNEDVTPGPDSSGGPKELANIPDLFSDC